MNLRERQGAPRSRTETMNSRPNDDGQRPPTTLTVPSTLQFVQQGHPAMADLPPDEDKQPPRLTPLDFRWQRLKFPHRLFHLINLMERQGLSHLAHWNEKGTCFRIPKSKELVVKYLAFFFQQNKWKSFQRQLNVYDFKRIESGRLKGYYYHPFFLRSNISLASKIQRRKRSNNGISFSTPRPFPVHPTAMAGTHSEPSLLVHAAPEFMPPRRRSFPFSSCVRKVSGSTKNALFVPRKNAPPTTTTNGDGEEKNSYHDRISLTNNSRLPSTAVSSCSTWSSLVSGGGAVREQQKMPPVSSKPHNCLFDLHDFELLDGVVLRGMPTFSSTGATRIITDQDRPKSEAVNKDLSSSSTACSSTPYDGNGDKGNVEDDDDGSSLATIDDLSDLIRFEQEVGSQEQQQSWCWNAKWTSSTCSPIILLDPTPLPYYFAARPSLLPDEPPAPVY